MNFNGYIFISEITSARSRGGLGSFIHSGIFCRIVSDFDSMYEETMLEFLIVELDLGTDKSLCCLFYRSPSSSA